MSIKVLETFKEKDHDGTIYSVGDDYPKVGFKSNSKRVSFLQEIHPVYGVRFLGPAEGKKVVVDKESDGE